MSKLILFQGLKPNMGSVMFCCLFCFLLHEFSHFFVFSKEKKICPLLFGKMYAVTLHLMIVSCFDDNGENGACFWTIMELQRSREMLWLSKDTNGKGKPGVCGTPHGTLKASELHCGFFYKQEVLGLRLESHSSPMRPVTATATDYTAEWVNHLLFSIRIVAITGHINNHHYYHEPITSWL